MADHVVVDFINLLHGTHCDKVYAGTFSVYHLLSQHIITITEAIDAFVYEMLHTKYIDFSIMLVLDCRMRKTAGRKNEHTFVSNGERSIDIFSVGCADDFIVGLFGPKKKAQTETEYKIPDYNKGDNVFVVTNDVTLKHRVLKANKSMPEHRRPNVNVVDVPSWRAKHPVVPMTIDIEKVIDEGLLYMSRSLH